MAHKNKHVLAAYQFLSVPESCMAENIDHRHTGSIWNIAQRIMTFHLTLVYYHKYGTFQTMRNVIALHYYLLLLSVSGRLKPGYFGFR